MGTGPSLDQTDEEEAGVEDADQWTIPMMSSCILEINQHRQEAGGAEDAKHPHDVLYSRVE